MSPVNKIYKITHNWKQSLTFLKNAIAVHTEQVFYQMFERIK